MEDLTYLITKPAKVSLTATLKAIGIAIKELQDAAEEEEEAVESKPKPKSKSTKGTAKGS